MGREGRGFVPPHFGAGGGRSGQGAAGVVSASPRRPGCGDGRRGAEHRGLGPGRVRGGAPALRRLQERERERALQAQGWGWGLAAWARSGRPSRCLSVLPGLGVLPAPNPEVACSGLPEQRARGTASAADVLSRPGRCKPGGRVGFPRGLPPWLVDELSPVRASLRCLVSCVWISSRRTPVRGTRTHSERFLLK